jgi:hypothetical protein
MRFNFRLLLLPLLFLSCQPGADQEPPLFSLLGAEETGVDFSNTLKPEVDFNILNYLYFYNGGGVAIGDINNDSLPDLYFSANQAPNKLYLNRGSFRFEDITEQAGVAGQGDWSTGVSMADVNGDGWLDIYLCQVGEYEGVTGKNQLFINQQDGSFAEQAAAYGLDFHGFSTQSCFFDYDRDGDLDMYLLNHSVHAHETYKRASIREHMHPTAGDRLFRNDGERFTDVTAESGIYSSEVGYGLGVVAGDLNQDGWPDLYIGNDFHEDDYLYLNQGDGTFAEVLKSHIGHTSRFSMGVEMADFNNDGLLDLLSLDMKPEREDILKTSEGAGTYDLYRFRISYGYGYQYPRNALQLNRGMAPGDSAPLFSEIAQLAGIDATDWSWSALFADYDLDGHKDLFISNGIYRRPNDMDYIKFLSDPNTTRSLNEGVSEESLEWIEKMPQVRVASYAYRNEGELRFSKQTQSWGLEHPAFSNGAAYADLDNDGDLDLVINNLNEPAFLYRNNARQQTDNRFLKVRLEGKEGNRWGIGTKVWVKTKGQELFQEMQPTRGFQSSVAPELVFGLGKAEKVEAVQVSWPDGTTESRKGLAVNQLLTFRQSEAGPAPAQAEEVPEPLFREVADQAGLDFVHRENRFNDFARESLMPHQLSTQGPALAVADLNGDGLDDVFIGGASRQAGALYVQDPLSREPRFLRVPTFLFPSDSLYEDVAAVFFDADGDQDLDLYVGSGGNEYSGTWPTLRDRLYINTGLASFGGRKMAPQFVRADSLLPAMYDNTGCVRPADFDQDGDLDLFVGGRVVSRAYGLSPRSYLLENDGSGRFRDVTESLAPELAQPGMVCDAQWLELDGQPGPELAVVGEWLPLRLYQPAKNWQQTTLANSHGWWNCLEQADLDGDGDLDLIAGNLGLNSVLKAHPKEPATLYLNDFDQNQSLDHILSFYKNGESYPFAQRDELLMQLAFLKKQYPNYRDYALQGVEDIFGKEALEKSKKLQAETFASAWFENQGNLQFQLRELPREGQFAPVMDLLVHDFNADQQPDLLLAGNFYGTGPNVGRYDASLGSLLLGQAAGLQALEPRQSGLWLRGEARRLALLKSRSGYLLLVARNDAAGQLFELLIEE